MNIRVPGDYFVIPIQICQYSLREGMVKELKLYMAMKLMSSGKVEWNSETKKLLTKKMKVTVRTIENLYPKMASLNWIRVHNKDIYLQKFDFIAMKTGATSGTGVIFYPDDLRHFRVFLVGATMGYLVNMQKLKLRNERRHLGLQTKWGNNSTGCRSFFPIANKALAKILNCSLGTAYNYKLEAVNYRYILLQKSFSEIKNVSVPHLQTIRKALPEDAHRIVISDDKVAYQLPDMIAPMLKYKVRKKLKHNKGGYRGNSNN